MLLYAFALNNDEVVNAEKDIKGDSTEIALLEVASEQRLDTSGWPRKVEIAFDAKRKLMTTSHAPGDRILLFTKGAPEILLQRCRNVNVQAMQ